MTWSSLHQLIADAFEDLSAAGAEAALVGALAVSARTEPRFTRDVDLVVSVTNDERALEIVRHMISRGYLLDATVEQERVNRLATARLVKRGSGGELDLLFASSGVEPEIVIAATDLELVEDLVAPVAVCGDLIALKLLARDDSSRPQDRIDLVKLLAVAEEQDLARAEKTIALVTERGYNRERDLMRALRDQLDPTGG